jgi:DNA-binding Xre family transcriptional regulator
MKNQIFKALKYHLKARGWTYRDLAQSIHVSEATIKRIFSKKKCDLDKLEKFALALGINLNDLVEEEATGETKLKQLSWNQESEIVSDKKFMLVSLCVQNGWLVEEIVNTYRISESECIGYLIRLEKLGLIDLGLNNRVRLKVDETFDWIPKGPIAQFFAGTAITEFLASDFDEEDAARTYMVGQITQRSKTEILIEIHRVRRMIANAISADRALPMNTKTNTGFFIAMRSWELSYFSELRQSKESKSRS